MVRRRFVVSLAIAPIISLAASADEPPSWLPFVVCSAERIFCAKVGPGAEDGWVLRVFDRDLETELWSSPYAYDGYAGGYLSEDARFFVDVNFWFDRDQPVIAIYSRDRRRVLPGNAFGISESKLLKTVSHLLWLQQDGRPVRFIDPENLSVATIDGRTHVVHLPSGRLAPR